MIYKIFILQLIVDLQMPTSQTVSLLNPVTSFSNPISGPNLSSEQTIAGYTVSNHTATSNISPVDMQRNAVYNTNSK